MNRTEILQKAQEQVLEYLGKLSTREKRVLISVVALLAVLALYVVADEISTAFDRQARELRILAAQSEQVTEKLTRYKTLVARQRSAEQQFKDVTFEGGVRSYLEKLIQHTGRIQSGQYKITPSRSRKLGENYELEPYNIRFETSNLKLLVNLLEKIPYGDKPLLITQLEIKKSRRSDKLTVSVDVSSIKYVG
ncbi:MAG: type II secretion system protein M [Bdellovibrionales bacterium]|nr:type II secretion system protein M [Bdellovibrionales bacterium]